MIAQTKSYTCAFFALWGLAFSACGVAESPDATDEATAELASNGYTTTAGLSAARVSPGQTTNVTVQVTPAVSATLLVDIEVRAANGIKVAQRSFDSQALKAGVTSSYAMPWVAPTTLGTYTVKVGIFNAGWGSLLHWNEAAATVAVVAPPPVQPLIVYGDALDSRFQNWSWSSTVNLASPTRAYAGTRSIA